MTAGRAASLVATCDQWVRASHQQTAVEGVDGALTLSWSEPNPAPAPNGSACPGRGVATDRLCRIYRLTADAVERVRVGPTRDGLDYADLPDPVTLIGPTPAPAAGADFTGPAAAPLGDPVGIAIDADDRLFVADRHRRTVTVIDLWSRRLLRSVAVNPSGMATRHPRGLVAHDGTVLVVVRDPAGLLRLSATRGPEPVAMPSGAANLPPGSQPSRVAVLPSGDPVVLWHEPDGTGWVVAGGRAPLEVGPASDIVIDAEGALVVAPCARPDSRSALRRLVATESGWTRTSPLDATGYDGEGLVLTRDGRVGYFTPAGFRLAVRAAVSYRTEGTCVTYRLDSGVARNRWGRLLLEACRPDGTSIRVGAVTSDDTYETESAHVAAEPAACVALGAGETPPLPPETLLGDVAEPTGSGGQLHRRPGATTPWWRPGADDPYETFEAPTRAPVGRYLWVTVHLQGNGRRTPKVREIRVERQAHTLMRHIPEVYAAEQPQADFLHRYLAMFDGMLHDLDLRAFCRDILVDPHSSPVEALDWLASFVGLVLDDRWALAARRQLVAEIVQLYRLRGTVWALRRYLEIFLAGQRAVRAAPGAVAAPAAAPAVTPVIIEHFRLRGLGGPLLGGDPTVTSRSVLGAGFRVGGEVGTLESGALDPTTDATSSFARHAHRFTVLVPRPLGAEEESAVRHVLDTERPAHTAYDLCTVDAGMRVGRGMHLGLSTIVGPTGAFETAVTGRSLLGRGAVLGGPSTGTAVESARVGSTRVG